MSDLEILRTLLFAGELLVASGLVLGGAWLSAQDKSASARHLTWVTAFAVLLILPAIASLVPSFVQILLPAPPPELPVVQDFSTAPVAAALPAPEGFHLDAATFAVALAALWLAGLCVMALRGAVAWAGLRALRRSSVLHEFDCADLPGAAAGRGCELRISTVAGGCGPITWGIFTPVILLPKAALLWPRERLRAVLLHELAHIRRHDSLTLALSRLACALYWPNPLVWMAARRLRREAELAADDAVLAAGLKPSAYAGALLELAAEFRGAQASLSHVPLSMAAPSALEARVKSVLAPTSSRSGVTLMDVLKIAGLGLIATAALAFARPSLAQDAPPASPVPVMSAEMATPPAAPVPPEAPPAPPAPPSDVATPPPPVPPAMQVNADRDDDAAGADHDNDRDADNDHDADNDNDNGNDEVTIVHSKNGHVIDKRTLRSGDIKKIRAIVAQARREAHAALERARPEIRRAMSEAHVSRQAMEAMRNAQPQIDAALAKVGPEIDKAMEQARAELAKADIDSKIKIRVDEALKRAEMRLQMREERLKARAGTAKDRTMRSDDESGAQDSSDGGSPE